LGHFRDRAGSVVAAVRRVKLLRKDFIDVTTRLIEKRAESA
jgi:hypothetical protein